MTPPTPLSAVELTRIAEWLDARQIYIPTSEVRKLFDSHRILAERLAACESLIERILDLTTEPAIDQRQLAYWRASALVLLGPAATKEGG